MSVGGFWYAVEHFSAKLASLNDIMRNEKVPADVRNRARDKYASAAAGAMNAIRPYAAQFGKGLAFAAPAVIGGSMLMRNAQNRAEKFRDDSMKKALGVGAGLAGMYGLARAIPDRARVRHDLYAMPQQPQPQQKVADVDSLVTKMAACVLLDDKLQRLGDEDLVNRNNARFAELMVEFNSL